jgi:putative ABC transport system permease protein
MNISDILVLSFKDLSEKKVRTALTVVMVVIGVASIVALVSLTAGISASISSELSSLGPTSIIMSSTGTGFTQATVSEIQTLPNASSVTPLLTGTAIVRYGSENTTAAIIGISPQNLQAFLGSVNLYQGSMYSGSISPESLVGYDIAFPSTSDGRQNIVVGQPISVTTSVGRGSTSITVPVVGILQSYSASIISVDSAVVMSLPAAETILHRTAFNTLIVKASNTSTVSGLANTITAIYGSTAHITTTEELAQTAASIVGDISTLLILIAGISLVVAAIGIMNVMLISVYERIHEIGILKAVGFKNRNILTIFIIQALIIGFFGGLVGIAVGAGGAYGLSALISSASAGASTNSTATTSSSSGGFRSGSGAGAGGGAIVVGGTPSSSSGSISFTPVITLSTILIAMLVAVVVSVAAGAYPAWRASQLEPIEALRTL